MYAKVPAARSLAVAPSGTVFVGAYGTARNPTARGPSRTLSLFITFCRVSFDSVSCRLTD